jgi:hypothetical protein
MRIRRHQLPKKIVPVAKMLVYVVPSLEAMSLPTKGAQVVFKLNAKISRLNSVFEVPIARDRRDLRGPRILEPLEYLRKEY